jgi:CheY-like chemotaxis protein
MDALNPSGVVLHVEDDADLRNSMSAMLRLAGFRAHGADSAHTALTQASLLKDELDVLIVDYHLGIDLTGAEMTGTEVAETIARRLGRSLPTIILTGDPANLEIPLLTNAPVWVVRKPANPDLLTSALPSLVAFHRAVRGFGGGNWQRGGFLTART